MAATIGNFSSGDVLTAAQMNTLGLEWLDDQTFSGYGGVESNVLSGDFTTYFVSFFGYLTSGASGIYLRFMRSGSELTGTGYNFAATQTNFSTGAVGAINATGSTNIRLGGINTSGSMTSMFITLGQGNRAYITHQSIYGSSYAYNGSGQYYDGTAVDGLKIYRTSNLAKLKMRVYGLRN